MMYRDDICEFAVQKAREWATGNHGARMLGGNCSYFHEIEQEIAEFYHMERCMIMSSG